MLSYKLKNSIGNKWWLVAVAAMLVLFLTVASKNESLDPYMGGDSTYTIPAEEAAPAADAPDLTAFVDPKTGASMSVPADWTYVLVDGRDTWVHQPSATSIQFQSLDYYPQVNQADAETLAESCAALGRTMTDFQRKDETSYVVVSASAGAAGVTDYVETVRWDRSSVVKVVATVDDVNYDRMEGTLSACLDSFEWVPADPVPEGTCLVYSRLGDFEFPVPSDWTVDASAADGFFYASSVAANADMRCEAFENPTLMEDFSQLDYSEYFSQGRPGFVLTAYSVDGQVARAQATYYAGDVQMTADQRYEANGKYHYVTTFSYPSADAASMAPFAAAALDAVRVFYVPTQEELAASEEARKGLFDDESADSFASEMDELASMEEGFGDGAADDLDAAADGGGASSFASALVAVAGIDEASAAALEAAWNDAGFPAPTYAEGVMESDVDLCVLVTDSQGQDWYLWIGKDGTFEDLRVGSPDGRSVFASE